MVTAILIVLAVLVLVGFVGLCYQMATCPLSWLFHTCNGSLGLLAELFAAIITAIADANN